MKDYTNVVQLASTLVEELEEFLESNSLLGMVDSTKLLAGFKDLLELLNNPVVSKPLDNYQVQVTNAIDRYGVAELVVDLAEQNQTPAQIAKSLEKQGAMVSARDVSSFLADYKTTPITHKIERVQHSVFDTAGQLQDIFERLKTILDSLEHVDDDRLTRARKTREELQLQYMAEIRQCLITANDLAIAIENMNKIKDFNATVLRIVLELAGAGVYNSLVKELRTQRLIHGIS